jgi:hypothetical protein
MNRADKVIQGLEKNNMQGFFAENKHMVVPIISKHINPGDTVAAYGLQSLHSCGLINLLKCGKYKYLDMYKPGLSENQKYNIFIDSFSADVFLCSCTAITENGKLYNYISDSNNAAPITYGPKSVIVVVGWNKIVKDSDEMVHKTKPLLLPFGINPHKTTLNCLSHQKNPGYNYLAAGYQKIASRIKVIIVGENL